MAYLNYKEFIGETYNKLKILSIFFKNGNAWAKCECACGNKCKLNLSSIRHSRQKSCGCLRIEKGKKLGSKYGKLKVIHGEAKNGTITVEYSVLRNMLSRCYNENDVSFKYYGARGISVFSSWCSTKNGARRFINWLLSSEGIGRRPSPKYSIDRIDNDGNYEPGNLKWSTRKQQQNNRRKYKLKDA